MCVTFRVSAIFRRPAHHPERERRSACDPSDRHPGQKVDDLFGATIAEVFLLRVGAHVRKGQHGDGGSGGCKAAGSLILILRRVSANFAQTFHNLIDQIGFHHPSTLRAEVANSSHRGQEYGSACWFQFAECRE
jgi:hypothetical protein